MIRKIFRWAVVKSIRLYQATLSPDHSRWGKSFRFVGCRFYPSCSEYACQSIQRYGLRKSCFKILKRLCRCHPWAEGGVDLPEGEKE